MFKAAVCPALNPLNAPNALQGPAGKPYVQQQPGPQPLQFNKFQRLVAHLFFRVFKATVCPPSKLLNPLNPPSRSQDRPRPTVFTGVQGCRLPGLKPLKRSKRFAGPRRQAVRPAAARATTPSIQQIPAVGSPPVFQSLQAYRLPASKLLNPLNPPVRSQDRPRPTVFTGAQGCRLPGLKPLKRSKRFEGPRRQAVRPAAASATAPSIQQIPAVGTPNCVSESSRLPFAPPQSF